MAYYKTVIRGKAVEIGKDDKVYVAGKPTAFRMSAIANCIISDDPSFIKVLRIDGGELNGPLEEILKHMTEREKYNL